MKFPLNKIFSKLYKVCGLFKISTSIKRFTKKSYLYHAHIESPIPFINSKNDFCSELKKNREESHQKVEKVFENLENSLSYMPGVTIIAKIDGDRSQVIDTIGTRYPMLTNANNIRRPWIVEKILWYRFGLRKK